MITTQLILNNLPFIIIFILTISVFIMSKFYKAKISRQKNENFTLSQKVEKLDQINKQMQKAIDAQKIYKKKQMELEEELGFAMAENKEVLKEMHDNGNSVPLINRLNMLYSRMHNNNKKKPD